MFEEGLQNRYERHARLSQKTRDWAAANDFTLFPEAGYESRTLTCVNNGAKEGGRVIDLPKFVGLMKEEGILIDGGVADQFRRIVRPALQEAGCRPQSLVLTHPDGGHVGGLGLTHVSRDWWVV